MDGSCNVNWQEYYPGGKGNTGTLASLGRLLAYFVVLFPAIDVTSVYPLNVMVSEVLVVLRVLSLSNGGTVANPVGRDEADPTLNSRNEAILCIHAAVKVSINRCTCEFGGELMAHFIFFTNENTFLCVVLTTVEAEFTVIRHADRCAEKGLLMYVSLVSIFEHQSEC